MKKRVQITRLELKMALKNGVNDMLKAITVLLKGLFDFSKATLLILFTILTILVTVTMFIRSI